MTARPKGHALRRRRPTAEHAGTNPATAGRISTAEWRVVAASVRGVGHHRTGQPCQDAHYWSVAPDGTLVAAVADGAGSARFGDVGARVATRAAVAALEPRSLAASSSDDDEARTVLIETLTRARAALDAEAVSLGVATQELATTLILIVASSDGAIAAQVGDGAAVVQSADGRLSALTTPRAGEYVNETTFLTSADALASAQCASWRGPLAHLGVLSDGLQMLALVMPGGTPHAPFFAPLLRFATQASDAGDASAQLASFLGGPRVTARTDDDVTLLLATRTVAPAHRG